MEACLDCMGAVELSKAVKERFDVELPATIECDHPTIGDLAHYLAQRTLSRTMQASIGGFDQMQAFVSESSRAAEIVEVHSVLMMPCLHLSPAFFMLIITPLQSKHWPVGVLFISDMIYTIVWVVSGCYIVCLV
jgi:hypothetical protein